MRRGLALLVLAAAMLPACSTQVAFKQDKRVHILYPHAGQKVQPPVTVRWTVDDFQVTGPTPAKAEHAGYFAVLIDRSPQPPGEPLSWFARNDRVCHQAPACPDTAYLNRHDIYTTTDTSFPVPVLRAPPSGSKGKNTHEVTVVLLDGTGRRVGETAFAVEFEVPKVRL